MLYMNPYYLDLFDRYPNNQFYSGESGPSKGCLSYSGGGEKSFYTEADKIYVSLEVMLKGNISYSLDSWFFCLYSANNRIYLSCDTSKQIYYFSPNGTDDKTVSASIEGSNQWTKMYMVFDKTNDTVKVYKNGELAITYSFSFNEEPITCFRLAAASQGYGSLQLQLRNVIVSDEYFSPNAEIREITLTNSEDTEWNKSDNSYSTEELNKSIVFIPNATSFEGYKVSGSYLTFKSKTGSIFNKVNITSGSKSVTETLSNDNKNTYVNLNCKSISDITLTSSE